MNPTFVNAGSPSTPTPAVRGRPRGAATGAFAPTGAKRGRKPRGALPAAASPARPFTQDPQPTTSLPTPVHWSTPITAAVPTIPLLNPHAPAPSALASAVAASILSARDRPTTAVSSATNPSTAATGIQPLQGQPASTTTASILSQVQANPSLLSTYPSSITPLLSFTNTAYPKAVPEEDADVDDELFPAMADDDYSAQLSWQSQSKDNLKVLMDNFSPAQYDRFEAYRRHALPKQAVRKVIQQSTGQQVSQPVAQIVAGFAKVFVGEIVEKARAVQKRRGDTGPLSPDHLREAYRMYQLETGRVGAARPLRSKRLFVR